MRDTGGGERVGRGETGKVSNCYSTNLLLETWSMLESGVFAEGYTQPVGSNLGPTKQ